MTKAEVQFFDNIATEWDGMEVRSTPQRVRYILDTIGIEPGSRVLDLGTGTGVLVPYLWELTGEGGSVTAVDYSEGMLSVARGKYEGLPDVEFVRCDFENEPLPGRYDTIMMYCVYPHLHRPGETLRRLIDQNLKPGGKIAIAFPSDESFINHVHGDRKVESDYLPSAAALAGRLRGEGFDATAVSASAESYIVIVR